MKILKKFQFWEPDIELLKIIVIMIHYYKTVLDILITLQKIVITDFQNEEIEIEDVAKYRKQVIRHELIHAFLCESGLHENCEWHNEEMVDWLAMQAPKLQKYLKKLNIFNEQV